MTRYYAGIGSRSISKEVGMQMQFIAQALGVMGYTLRSGGAAGSDSEFEKGTKVLKGLKKEIYIPWEGFNNRTTREKDVILPIFTPEHMEVAASLHPNWEACSDGAKKLHTRNLYQVAGLDGATFVDFVICWTPNGSGSGGTGQAIRLANQLNIPVYDLGKEGGYKEVITFLGKQAKCLKK